MVTSLISSLSNSLDGVSVWGSFTGSILNFCSVELTSPVWVSMGNIK